jgi:hypothetical protein
MTYPRFWEIPAASSSTLSNTRCGPELVLANQEFICRRAQYAEPLKTTLGKVLDVWRDDHIRACHDGSRQPVPVILLWKAAERFRHSGRNG